jgi:segregation and condensation protein A
MQRVLALHPEQAPLDTVVAPPKVTIRDQIRLIARTLRSGAGRTSFQSMLAGARSRMELVVTFLAVLELVKRRKIEARQERQFGEIVLLALSEWSDEELAELEFE